MKCEALEMALAKKAILALILALFSGCATVKVNEGWKKFDINGSIKTRAVVRSIAAGPDREIYFCDEKNVYRADENTSTSIVTANSMRFLSVFSGKDRALYVVCDGGDPAGTFLGEIKDGNLVKYGTVKFRKNSLFQDSKSRVWTVTDEGKFAVFNDKKWLVLDIGPDEKNAKKSAKGAIQFLFHEDIAGKIWTWGYRSNQIFCFDDTDCLKVVFNEPAKIIYYLIETSPGFIMIHASGNLMYKAVIEKENKAVHLYEVDCPFSRISIMDSFRDINNRTYVISADGVSRLDNNEIVNVVDALDYAGSYLVGSHYAFLNENDGGIVLGSKGAGVVLISPKGDVKEIGADSGLDIKHIENIAENKAGKYVFFGYNSDAYDKKMYSIDKEEIHKLEKLEAIDEVFTYGDIKKTADNAVWYVNKEKKLCRSDGSAAKEILDVNDMKGFEKEGFGKLDSTYKYAYFAVDSSDRIWLYYSSTAAPDAIYTTITGKDGKVLYLDLNTAYSRFLTADTGMKFIKGCSYEEEPFAPVVSKSREIYYYTDAKKAINCFNGKEWGNINLGMIFNDSSKVEIKYPLFLTAQGVPVMTVYYSSDAGKKISYLLENNNINKTIDISLYEPANNGNALIQPSHNSEKTFKMFNGNKVNGMYFEFYPRQTLCCNGLVIEEDIPVVNRNSRRIFYFQDEDAVKNNTDVIPYELDNAGRIWLNTARNNDNYKSSFEWYVIDVRKKLEKMKQVSVYFTYLNTIEEKRISLPDVEYFELLEAIESNSLVIGLAHTGKLDVNYAYNLDNAGWVDVAGDALVLKAVKDGAHVLEIKGSKGGFDFRASRLKFNVDFNIERKLDKAFAGLSGFDPAEREKAAKLFVKYGSDSREYLKKKLEATNDESMKWEIEAVLSRIE